MSAKKTDNERLELNPRTQRRKSSREKAEKAKLKKERKRAKTTNDALGNDKDRDLIRKQKNGLGSWVSAAPKVGDKVLKPKKADKITAECKSEDEPLNSSLTFGQARLNALNIETQMQVLQSIRFSKRKRARSGERKNKGVTAYKVDHDTIDLSLSLEEDTEEDDHLHEDSIFVKGPGFIKFFKNAQFTDTILELQNNVRFKVHRLILAYSSRYFKKYFVERDIERSVEAELDDQVYDVVKINFNGPTEVFRMIINYFYTGTIKVTSDNVIPIWVVAEQYDMPSLRKKVTRYIKNNLERTNAVPMLRHVIKFNVKDQRLISRCVHKIARNFCYIYNEDYHDIPYDIFDDIISHRNLALKGEWLLYTTIKTYIAHMALTSKQKQRLFREVRYRFMKYDQLAKVRSEGLVNESYLLDAAMKRLSRLEQPSASPPLQQPIYLLPRPEHYIDLVYNKDSDDFFKGIIWWVATNYGRYNKDGTVEWQNPHEQKRVVVESSPLSKGQVSTLVDTAEAEIWTQDVPCAWFSIDFGKNRRLIPNRYSLRHGGNWKADAIRRWELQASQDSEHWDILKRHDEDCSLNSAFAQHTWSLDYVTKAYRFFKVLQTGKNSSRRNFLVLSGFEFYGRLFDSTNDSDYSNP